MPTAPKAHRSRHGRPRGPRRDRRKPANERGYDSRWTKLRAAYVAEYPLCEDCLPTPVPVHEVDHIIPIDSIGHPLRLDWSNLRSRCRRCHAIKTARYDRLIEAEYKIKDDAGIVIERWRDIMSGDRDGSRH